MVNEVLQDYKFKTNRVSSYFRFLFSVDCKKFTLSYRTIMSGTAFRGVSAEQDSRFGNKEKKLLKSLAKTFPPEFKEKPALENVHWESIKPWIAQRITELLNGVEDDVLIQYAIEQVEGKKEIDPRMLQISLTGFLEKNTGVFCKELWNLLISASKTPSGIPQEFLDAKAKEIRQKEEERQRMYERMKRERRKYQEYNDRVPREERRDRRRHRDRDYDRRHRHRDGRDDSPDYRASSRRSHHDERRERRRSRSRDRHDDD